MIRPRFCLTMWGAAYQLVTNPLRTPNVDHVTDVQGLLPKLAGRRQRVSDSTGVIDQNVDPGHGRRRHGR